MPPRSLLVAIVAVLGIGGLGACEWVMGDLPPKQNQPLQLADASVVAGAAAPPLPVSGQTGGRGDVSRSDAGPRDANVANPEAGQGGDLGKLCDGGSATLFYRDQDHDGYGDPMATMLRCAPADGWTENNKDCNDDEADVHPGQIAYFGFGYRSPPNPTGTSFDYNCDGAESAAPNQELGPLMCVGLLNLICGHSGFGPNAERAGITGINAYCGSNIITSCDALLCQAHQTTGDAHYECN